MKRWKSCLGGVVLALLVSMLLHRGAFPHVVFHAGLYPVKQQREVIERTIKMFNVGFATFFNTGGGLQGLNEFPAANLVKRRIFQDINSLKASNTLLVCDRDVSRTTSIKFVDYDRAIAETEEMWFLSLQDPATRRPLSPVKAEKIQVRYLLKATTGRWQVEEFNVFAAEDNISQLPVKEF